MNFNEALRRATAASITTADIAGVAGAGADADKDLVRQVRMHPLSTSYRPPPHGWEAAIAELALERAAELEALAKALEKQSARAGQG